MLPPNRSNFTYLMICFYRLERHDGLRATWSSMGAHMQLPFLVSLFLLYAMVKDLYYLCVNCWLDQVLFVWFNSFFNWVDCNNCIVYWSIYEYFSLVKLLHQSQCTCAVFCSCNIFWKNDDKLLVTTLITGTWVGLNAWWMQFEFTYEPKQYCIAITW